MSREMMIAILMADNCTAKEAEKHLKEGTTIYENTEEEKAGFIKNCIGCGSDEAEAVELWDCLDDVEYNGVLYKIDYVL